MARVLTLEESSDAFENIGIAYGGMNQKAIF